MKPQERIRAIKLRKKGKSYKEILKEVKVSKGTLSVWLRDVPLTKQQKDRLYITLKQRGAYRAAKARQQARIDRTEEIIIEAKREAKYLIKNPLFLAGLMLYWAEGDKSDEVELVKFSNSDSKMIEFIMRWFREICEVPEEKFKVCVHAHSLHCRKEIESFWSKVTGVPSKQFYKTQIKPTSLGYRKNKLYNGTCAVGISNKDLFRRIKGWKLAFIEEMDSKKKIS